jgi:hypothetical protein
MSPISPKLHAKLVAKLLGRSPFYGVYMDDNLVAVLSTEIYATVTMQAFAAQSMERYGAVPAYRIEIVSEDEVLTWMRKKHL